MVVVLLLGMVGERGFDGVEMLLEVVLVLLEVKGVVGGGRDGGGSMVRLLLVVVIVVVVVGFIGVGREEEGV